VRKSPAGMSVWPAMIDYTRSMSLVPNKP
jgi:hypothetical protein